MSSPRIEGDNLIRWADASKKDASLASLLKDVHYGKAAPQQQAFALHDSSLYTIVRVQNGAKNRDEYRLRRDNLHNQEISSVFRLEPPIPFDEQNIELQINSCGDKLAVIRRKAPDQKSDPKRLRQSSAVHLVLLPTDPRKPPRDYCKTKALDSDLFSITIAETIQVRQAEWHPLSVDHIVCLCSDDKLRVYNVLCESEPEQLISLETKRVPGYPHPRRMNPVAFCFGAAGAQEAGHRGPGGWDQLGVFVLEQKGEVSFVSPLVPYEAEMSSMLFSVSLAEGAHEGAERLLREWKAEIVPTSIDEQPSFVRTRRLNSRFDERTSLNPFRLSAVQVYPKKSEQPFAKHTSGVERTHNGNYAVSITCIPSTPLALLVVLKHGQICVLLLPPPTSSGVDALLPTWIDMAIAEPTAQPLAPLPSFSISILGNSRPSSDEHGVLRLTPDPIDESLVYCWHPTGVWLIELRFEDVLSRLPSDESLGVDFVAIDEFKPALADRTMRRLALLPMTHTTLRPIGAQLLMFSAAADSSKPCNAQVLLVGEMHQQRDLEIAYPALTMHASVERLSKFDGASQVKGSGGAISPLLKEALDQKTNAVKSYKNKFLQLQSAAGEPDDDKVKEAGDAATTLMTALEKVSNKLDGVMDDQGTLEKQLKDDLEKLQQKQKDVRQKHQHLLARVAKLREFHAYLHDVAHQQAKWLTRARIATDQHEQKKVREMLKQCEKAKDRAEKLRKRLQDDADATTVRTSTTPISMLDAREVRSLTVCNEEVQEGIVDLTRLLNQCTIELDPVVRLVDEQKKDRSKEIMCNYAHGICSDVKVALYYCPQCDQYLCNDCQDLHSKQRSMRSHKAERIRGENDSPQR